LVKVTHEMKVTFEINGRPVNPRNLGDLMEQAFLQAIEKDVREPPLGRQQGRLYASGAEGPVPGGEA
jgi:hypothetical protein